MDYLSAFIYGAIQGLSEFLPISSSGHLALLPYVMNIQDPGVLFDLCMHLGTALAVMIYFKKELVEIIQSLPKIFSTKSETQHYFTKNLMLATMTSVLVIIILLKPSQWARSPYVIIFNQVFFGILLWLADRYQRRQVVHRVFDQKVAWKESMLMGVAQAIAIFPGVSRSGITLSTSFFLKISRENAGKFSFMMSLPIILAGIIKEIPDLQAALSTKYSLGPLVIGVISSFLVGLLTIHYFLKLISKINLGIFTLYRILISILMLWFLTY